METIHAPLSVSISELKKNPSAIIEQAQGQPVVILNHNKPSAYIVPIATYEILTNQQQSKGTLADLILSLPTATSYSKDPLEIQQDMRNEW